MKKAILFTIGIISLALGIIGIFLPVLPTTPFVILAAWCFLRSSPQAHQWLYRQPVIGDVLRNWEDSRSISRKTKITAIAMIALSLVVIWLRVEVLGVQIAVTALLIGVSAFICTRPEA